MNSGQPPDDLDSDSVPVLSGWLTREELSGQLGITVETLSRWGTQGIGPVFIRIGSRIYYRREAVRLWLVDQEKRRRR